MPYDWTTGRVGPTGLAVPTDPRATAGIGHPSFLNPLYPNSGGVAYHTYAPTNPKGRWTLPTGSTLGFKPGSGYYAKKGLTSAANPSPQATDPWTKLLTQVMGGIETPAQMEARVNREIDAQIAAQKKLLDDTYAKQRADAMAQMQGMAAAGAAAAAMNKDLFGAVGGEFNAAAGEIKGLAHGLSKNAQGATAGDVAKANAALGALGNAPVTEGGTFGVGGGTQQGVEEYRGGTLAEQMFGTQGEAANFGLAGMIGSQALQATQEAQAALIKTTRDINDSQSKAMESLAAGRLDLYHQYMSDAKDSQIKYISLAQGIQAAQAAGTTKPITRMVNGVLNQYDPTTRKWVPVAGKPKAPTPVKLQTKEFADGIWSWNPVTGKKVKFLGKPKATSPKNLVWKDKLMPDGKYHTVGLDPVTGKVVDPGWISKTQGPAPKGAKVPPDSVLLSNIKKWHEGVSSVTKTTNAQGEKSTSVTVSQAPISYQQALQKLLAMKEPKQKALQLLNSTWKRGEGGRPWLDANARAALTKAGLKPQVRYIIDYAQKDQTYKGKKIKAGAIRRKIPYLLRAQLNALEAAGIHIPGAWSDHQQGVQGPVYIVAAGV